GDWNQAACTYQNEKLWTAGRYGQVQTEAILIDGDAGVVLDTVDIPGLKPDQFGLYGGAVDSEGNFWTTGWATGNHLVRVDIDTMDATVWPGPSIVADSHWYGMTVDVDGYVWNCAMGTVMADPGPPAVGRARRRRYSHRARSRARQASRMAHRRESHARHATRDRALASLPAGDCARSSRNDGD
ncbi:MAG: hypothetical protein ABIZ80_10310, partial [Bryobacteraceae bacterium]